MKLIYRNKPEKWWLRIRLEITILLVSLAQWIIPPVPEVEEEEILLHPDIVNAERDSRQN